MMQIQSKIWAFSCLWLGLQVTSSHGLHCFDCMGCGQINWDSPSYSKCAEGEVCSKDIMFYVNKTTVVLEKVRRSCVEYNPEWGVLSDCVWKKGVSPPYSGIRCLCNDTEYCNGSVFVSANFQLLTYVLCLLVTFQTLI